MSGKPIPAGPWGSIDPPLRRALAYYPRPARDRGEVRAVRTAAESTFGDGVGLMRAEIATGWLVTEALPILLAQVGADAERRRIAQQLRLQRLSTAARCGEVSALIVDARRAIAVEGTPPSAHLLVFNGAGPKGAAELAYQFGERQPDPPYLAGHAERLRCLARAAVLCFTARSASDGGDS